MAAIVGSAIGGIALSFARAIPALALAGLMWQALSMASGIAAVAWLKDLLPEENRGKFLGIRMIFWIAIPMVLGSAIGSSLIQRYGIPTVSNGEAGFIPVPILFQVGSAIALVSIIPLLFARSSKKSA
jgi:MFS family permease